MVNTMARKSDIPPIDTAELADWLAPRPEESYEQWSKRFDKAERTIARREVQQTVRARQRTSNARASRRAA